MLGHERFKKLLHMLKPDVVFGKLSWPALITAMLGFIAWEFYAQGPNALSDLGPYTQTISAILLALLIVMIIQKLDRDATRKQVQEYFETLLRQYFPLGINATSCGLRAIYPSRAQSLPAVYEAIDNAQSRVLIIGVALKEIFDVDAKIDSIRAKITRYPAIDMRFLTLNPLTSPAVFRSFFETDPQIVKKYIKIAEHGAPSTEHYEQSQLFVDCYQRFRTLNRQIFHKCVRYYRRDPLIWMVMLDNRVFVEPYTFGRTTEQQQDAINLRLGGHMPVLEFGGEDAPPYLILKDHFERLWNTSTDDNYHMERAYQHKSDILKEGVFDVRLEWLRAVADTLDQPQHSDGVFVERREFPRQPWKTTVTINGRQTPMAAALTDCSRFGLGAIISGEDAPIEEGEVVDVLFDRSGQSWLPANRFRVAHISKIDTQSIRLGLRQMS